MSEKRAKKPVPVVAIAEIRRAIADYMNSEGCSCCRDQDRHNENEALLAKLLKVPHYSDGSGWDFGRFKTKG